MFIAQSLILLAGIYAAAGLVLASAFLTVGLRRVDPAADGASLGFRLLILPGVAALWPFIALKWIQSSQKGQP
jgi:hypothetical protein